MGDGSGAAISRTMNLGVRESDTLQNMLERHRNGAPACRNTGIVRAACDHTETGQELLALSVIPELENAGEMPTLGYS